MFDLLGGHGKVTQILEPRKAFAGSKPTSNFLPCGSRLPLTTKRRPTIALLSKLRRPLNVIHGNARFTKFNRARGNSVDDRIAGPAALPRPKRLVIVPPWKGVEGGLQVAVGQIRHVEQQVTAEFAPTELAQELVD